MTTEDNLTQTIVDKLSQYRPLRTQRYAAVNVLLITWLRHDFGAGFDQETAELQGMFRDTFNYNVWPYKIPSQDPGRSLNACVAQFVKGFGGENNLMIVFYSGHGGPESETGVERSCIWAAKIREGPTLDWSEIQPQLFLASCDVAIILDSCYAGQAARSRTSRRVEFLAATDKDNWTPTGMAKWPSFTKVLIREMKKAVLTEGLVTLSALQSRMVVAEAGLKRQPFLVSLAGSASEGPIKLSRLLEDPGRVESNLTPVSASINSIYLRLCLFQPLDGTTSPSLLRWLTRDSPASVEDIQLIDQTLAEAKEINDLGMDFFGSRDVRGGDRMLSLLSNEWQAEAQRLLQDLRATLCDSGLTLPATHTVTRTILDNVKEASSRLVEFVADSFASMGEEALHDFRSCDSTDVQDIKERIAMRLTLLSDNALPDNPIRVTFPGNAAPNQRLRFGKQGNDDVLVEYIYYDSEDPLAFDRMSYQVKRINALLSEPQNSAFRCLETSGFSHETLCGPRFGLVHTVPKALVNRKYVFLADLMNQAKNVPLDRRVRLAGIICDAVLHLHSVGWFHKSIKSENVVIFSLTSGDDDSALMEEWDFENPFLVGFDCSRPADAETRDTVDFTTKNNIYRHPDRWGRSIRFEKYHDLYSLGILLMEIGCWRSLPSMDSKRSSFDYIRDPEALRSLLLKAVRTKLAHAAGTRYAEAVGECLEKREWKTLEEWKSQKLVREKVLGPLIKCAEMMR